MKHSINRKIINDNLRGIVAKKRLSLVTASVNADVSNNIFYATSDMKMSSLLKMLDYLKVKPSTFFKMCEEDLK